MGSITSNIGLITGVPITDTVNQLLAIEARPRDLIVNRNKTLGDRSLALTDVSAAILKLQLRANGLSRTSLFQQTNVTSSNPDLVTVTSTTTAPIGNYSVTPVRLAQSQRLTSSAIASSTAALGGGTFSVRFGGFVDKSVPIDAFNAGAGIDRGQIRITDRSGASTVVDLRLANSVEDVVEAINSNGNVRVRIEGNGDGFRIFDESLGTPVGNLKIEDVGTGTTAVSLGINVDVAADVADGADVLRLYDQLSLDQLNDGGGIGFDEALADLAVTLRDGSELEIDFKKIPVLGGKPTGTTTAANGANARVKISSTEAGTEFGDVSVTFVADGNVTQGNEVVTYDEAARSLVFRIADGVTTANDIVAALENSQIAGAHFAAELTNNSNGTGLIDTSDKAFIGGLYAEATTPGVGTGGVADPNARIRFVANASGPEQNGLAIEFVVDGGLGPGGVALNYEQANDKLTISISDGQTTAADVIDAVINDLTVSQVITASLANGSDGTGIVRGGDDVTTAGAVIEPVPGTDELTVADVLATINASARQTPPRFPDGDSIRLIDLTSDLGFTFSVASLNASTAAEDLGLTGVAVGDTIQGHRVLSGINTTLLSSLAGGAGVGALGSIQFQDRRREHDGRPQVPRPRRSRTFSTRSTTRRCLPASP
ncbi:MAG: flagellar cap protein FliD N-terminal domain-containing protein [Pirellulales bacterium]